MIYPTTTFKKPLVAAEVIKYLFLQIYVYVSTTTE